MFKTSPEIHTSVLIMHVSVEEGSDGKKINNAILKFQHFVVQADR